MTVTEVIQEPILSGLLSQGDEQGYLTYDDILIYTKGKIADNKFYILISSKRAL